jgi:type I restriction enzyme S subunit
MQRLLTEGIGHTRFKETAIGRIPEEWSISRSDALCKVERGKFTYRPRNDPAFYDGKYPFIQTGDIEKSNIYIKHFSQTLNEKGLSVSKIFPSGIIAITIAANIGSVAITTFPVCFPDSRVAIAPHKIDLLFLYYYLKIRKQYLEMSATVSAQPKK